MIVEVVPAAVTSELRRAVLRPAWAPGTPMHGDDDPAAVHLAARDETGRVLGAAVLLARPFPAGDQREHGEHWQLRGMATAADVRGRGVGTSVVAAAEREAAARGARLLWCEAREHAIPFYAHRGFVPAGERFAHAETGIPHVLMYRELPGPSGSSE